MYGPPEIAKKYSDAGAAKTKLPIPKMLILSFFAGMFIAFGAFGSQVVGVGAGWDGLGKLLGALIFPVGLMMVLVAGAELFTGNNLIIISVLNKKATIAGMLRNWAFVYVGNFLGSLFVALMLTYSHAYSLFSGKLAESVVATAQTKCMLALPDAFLRGILCNILVCIAVWVSFSAEEVGGKIIGLCLPVTLFVASGYEHCIANMYFVPAGIFAANEYGIAAESALSWSGFLINNLLPVTIGNMLGGVCVVGLGYYFAYLHQGKTVAAPVKPQRNPDWDKKQFLDMSANQDVIGFGVYAETPAVPMASEPLSLPQNTQDNRIQVLLNGATVCVPNEVDPASLAQTIHVVKNLS